MADPVKYVNETDIPHVVNHTSGLATHSLDLRQDKERSKLARRKTVITRYLNVANALLSSRGSRKRLRELANKLESAIQELETLSENYSLLLKGEEFQRNLKDLEETTEQVNNVIQNIEVQLCERENEPPSETGSDAYFSTSLASQYVRSECSSRVSEAERKARAAALEVEQAKREAQRRAEEERRIAEEEILRQERERRLREERRIRELEYKAEQLRLEAQQDHEEPESLKNRLHDFEDDEDEPGIKQRSPIVTTQSIPVLQAEIPVVSSTLTPSPQATVSRPLKMSTLCNGTTPATIPFHCQNQDTEERLDVSWIQKLSDGSCDQRQATHLEQNAFVKSIPRLDLPQFSGDALEWPHFISLFKCLVHDQPLTDTQRMTHLQGALVGDAKRAVGGMLNHGHLYKAALRELEEQFGNEEFVAGAFLKTVFDHPKIPEDDLTQLRSFYNTLHVAVTTLKGLGYVHDLAATDVLRRVIQKLPVSLKNKWGEKKLEMRSISPTLSDLDEWLRSRVRAQAAVSGRPTNTNSAKPPPKNDHRKRNTSVPNRKTSSNLESTKTTTLTTSVSKVNVKKPSKSCHVCAQTHSIEKCEQFKAMDVDKRAQLAKEKSLCFSCLDSTEHLARNCERNSRCDVGECNKRHHPLIHGAAPVFVGTSSVACSNTTVLLQIVPIAVSTPGGVTSNTYALLDSGSQATLVLESFADKIGLKGERGFLQLGTINSRDDAKLTRRVSFSVGAVDESCKIPVEEAWTVQRLNLPPQKVTRGIMRLFPHLADLKLAEVDSKDVTILLGANVLDAILQRDVRQGSAGQPAAVLTAFGWTLTGSVKSLVSPERLHVMHVSRVLNPEETLVHRVEEWWRTEAFGTKFEQETPRSREDQRALEILERTVARVGDQYEVGLLWKDQDVKLPDNKAMAEKRLQSIEKRLKRDKALAEKYCAIIEDYVNKGYARKLTSEEASITTSKQWFLPHHPVQNPNKPGKVRMVMDAAAKHDGISLNDKLYTGPDLLNSLVGVLLRFREHKIAMSADIEAMFHQCKIVEEDQPALRFLWRNLDTSRPPDVYQMRVMIFGAASSPCTANYVLRKTARDNRGDSLFSTDTIKSVERNFYMDDFLKSVPDEGTAVRISSEITSLLARGGFRLTKWSSSSREVLAHIPPTEKASPSIDLKIDDLPTERTLGLLWNTERDGFHFSVGSRHPCDMTKRGVLSRLSTVFDPFGVLTPFTLPAKCLIQRLWQRKVDWDERLEEEDRNACQRWLDDLAELHQFELPRCLCDHTDSNATVQLHIFADASEKAFGAVCYARYAFPDERIHVAFVMAKNRVAPLKQLSIPRLELQAAVLAVRLNNTIKKELTIDTEETVFWSDSSTVLKYIRNESRRFHTFAANRVSEIQEASSCSRWKHVPGRLNPADDCTRGLRPAELNQHGRWITGPSFLWQGEDCWPREDPSADDLTEDDNEVKAKWSGLVEKQHANYPDPSQFSSWTRYRRVLAWIRRFLQNCKTNLDSRITGPLTASEILEAETLAVRKSQEESFHLEYETLKAGRSLPTKSKLQALRPWLDAEGLLRVGGRLGKAPLPEEARHPLILDPKHETTRMIILFHHLRLYCTSDRHLLNELRQRYWILKGMATVRRVAFGCLSCRKRRAKPMPPVMADLPKQRLGYQQPPFTNVGVDYFGPLPVRHGRKTEKRYGALFTCLTTRAVHIEIAHSLDTDSYIQAMRRMMARRGKPAHIWSDNGTNFVGAERELRDALRRLNREKICDKLSKDGVQWHFNPPSAPHFGGIWERLVQSAKRALRAVAGKQCVNDETLLTFMAEVESLLNGRPLTHVSSDYRDEEALTPNHFLLGRANPNFPPDVVTDKDLCSRKRWKHAQVMANHFWKRWLREYLPALTESRKWTKEVRNITKGDVVLVVDDNAPRGRWTLGRVLRPLPGDDGRVRAAKVRTKSGTYVRPVAKLCLLEEDASNDT